MTNHFLHALHATFADRAKHPAITHRDRIISFGELDALAQRCAGWLRTLGIARGDRVALCTPNKLPFLVAHLGTLYAGGVSLPLNPRFTREEVKFFLTDSAARVVVAGPEQCGLLQALQPELPGKPTVIVDAAVWSAPNAAYREPSIAADDPCLILYSSGTTGWPKGIVHTHANVANALRSLGRCWRLGPDDSVVNVLPLFHIHGLSIAAHVTLMTGGHLLIEDSFHPVDTLPVLGKATVFMAVPTIYYKFLEQPAFRAAAKSWSQIRLFTCGSAPIRPEVLPDLEAILGRPIINRYGMTEAFVITSLPLDGPWPRGSVGMCLDGTEMRVTDVQDNVGTVSIRGPNLFREYWGKPDAKAAAFATGWFETGDLGTLDAGGFLTLVGRKHDLIINSGYNVYPQVVERVLNECAGVRESAVGGVPDRHRGERVVAFVVKDDGVTLDDQYLLGYCRERLVDYQRPTEVVFVDSLPRNAMGKVLRRELGKNWESRSFEP